MTYEEMSALALKQIAENGAFLMTGKVEKNPMTIGWCQFGQVWNLPLISVFVRHSRYSHSLLERDRVFTLSFPGDGAMKSELEFCGTRSGKNVDKRKELGLSTYPSKTGGVDALGGCTVHFECRVLFQLEMGGHMDVLDQAVRDRFYAPQPSDADGDAHTIYYAQVLAHYRTE